MKPIILFVDDDRFWARHYIEAIRAACGDTHDVFAVYKADDALSYLRSDQPVAGIVLDVMMPVPTGVDKAVVDDGQKTGIYILKEMRELIIRQSISVFVFTNARLAEVVDEVERLEMPADLIECAQKNSVRARFFPDRFLGFLRRPKNEL